MPPKTLHWEIGRGGRRGTVPPETFHWEIFADKSGKTRQGKQVKNGKCGKREGKQKWIRFLFLFLFFVFLLFKSLIETTKFSWFYLIGNFYQEKT